MHEERWSSSGTERRGNFAGNEAALAHAGDDHASGAAKEEIHTAIKGGGHRASHAICQILEGGGLDANYIFASAVHGNRMVAEGRCAVGRDQWLVLSEFFEDDKIGAAIRAPARVVPIRITAWGGIALASRVAACGRGVA